MSKFQTFGNISTDMVVTNTSEWLQIQGIDPDEAEYENNPVIELVGRMIALDAAIFMQRRTAHLCGSNIDYLRGIYRDLRAQYLAVTGEDWDLKDFNKDIDW